MKKFLIALLMMAVVITGVFAVDGYKAPTYDATASEGTAQINITTTIKEEFPKFQLAVKTGAEVKTNDVDDTDDNYTESVLTATDLADVASSTRSVTFAINQISDSRTKENYTLTVAATDLFLVTKADGTTTIDFDTTQTSDQKFTVVAAAPTVSANTVTNIAPTASGAVLTTHYNGKKVKTNSAIELGTFTVAWNTNTDAEAGDYEAHITLTVASV